MTSGNFKSIRKKKLVDVTLENWVHHWLLNHWKASKLTEIKPVQQIVYELQNCNKRKIHNAD